MKTKKKCIRINIEKEGTFRVYTLILLYNI